MHTPHACSVVIGLGLLAVDPSIARAARPEAEDVGGLKRDVAERERQLTRAGRELAVARARLALAEGKRDRAADELRQAVAHCQSEVQWVRDHASWFCDPHELLTGAESELATDRAWLAEVEGDLRTLVAERKKLVGFREQRLETVRRLERAKAVGSAEVEVAQAAFDKARQRLAAAEKRLAAERTTKPGKPK